MQMIASLLLNLLKSYVAKLATEQFAHWAFFQIAEAIVNSTATKEDDKWLDKIKETVEKK